MYACETFGIVKYEGGASGYGNPGEQKSEVDGKTNDYLTNLPQERVEVIRGLATPGSQ